MFERVQLAQSVFIAKKKTFLLVPQLAPDSEQLKIINLLQIQFLNASEKERERFRVYRERAFKKAKLFLSIPFKMLLNCIQQSPLKKYDCIWCSMLKTLSS